jgi:hypothetical protein
MRSLRVASAVVYVGMVSYLTVKARPAEFAALRAWARWEWSRVRWLNRYESLPGWLQEAAEVRGWKPGESRGPLGVTEAPITSPEG